MKFATQSDTGSAIVSWRGEVLEMVVSGSVNIELFRELQEPDVRERVPHRHQP
jgi:hypothetical protein